MWNSCWEATPNQENLGAPVCEQAPLILTPRQCPTLLNLGYSNSEEVLLTVRYIHMFYQISSEFSTVLMNARIAAEDNLLTKVWHPNRLRSLLANPILLIMFQSFSALFSDCIVELYSHYATYLLPRNAFPSQCNKVCPTALLLYSKSRQKHSTIRIFFNIWIGSGELWVWQEPTVWALSQGRQVQSPRTEIPEPPSAVWLNKAREPPELSFNWILQSLALPL
jgi:hypothetical protein